MKTRVSGGVVSRVLDEKTGRYVSVLNVAKDPKAIDETKGILAEFNKRLDEDAVDTPDLVKEAWKADE